MNLKAALKNFLFSKFICHCKYAVGFTLIELLVTMSVIIILSSMLFLGKGRAEKELTLRRTAYRLAQELRNAQGKAMGAEKSQCGTNESHSFGIHFDSSSFNSYILFADCDNNQAYNSADDNLIETISLDKDVKVYSPTLLDIVFVPPEPKVYINSSSWGQESTVTFALKSDSSQRKSVKINSTGRIEL